jgi:hypothetical protein
MLAQHDVTDCVMKETEMMTTPNQALDRMTRSAISRMFHAGRHWRAPRHRSAFSWVL